MLPEGKFESFNDLANPIYKSKFVWQDPRIGGTGVTTLVAVYRTYGREGARTLLVDQDPLIVRGTGEVAEQHIRGARPVSLQRLSPDTLLPYRQAGVPLNLEVNLPQDLVVASTGRRFTAAIGGQRPDGPLICW